MRARDLLNKMAAAEEHFLESTFVAPVIRGGGVRVRVAGIVWQFAVVPAEYEGWAVLKPANSRQARVMEAAKLAQIRQYLDVFPMVSLVLCEKRKETWWGLLANDADPRFRLDGPVPVLLAKDIQLFDTVRTRWDGARFLFESKNSRRDPSVAAYLRQSLGEQRKPAELARPTLTAQERTAYEWQCLLIEQDLRDATEERLRKALAHADGKFRSFIERGDSYAVTFDVDGGSYTAAIRKDDLSVMLAGICLSGEDEKFDLTSLVGVIREGRDGYIVRIGDDEAADMPPAAYHRAHPPHQRRRRR